MFISSGNIIVGSALALALMSAGFAGTDSGGPIPNRAAAARYIPASSASEAIGSQRVQSPDEHPQHAPETSSHRPRPHFKNQRRPPLRHEWPTGPYCLSHPCNTGNNFGDTGGYGDEDFGVDPNDPNLTQTQRDRACMDNCLRSGLGYAACHHSCYD